MTIDKKWVTLNVGGTCFTTARSTLIKSTPVHSPLHRISNSSTNVEWDRNEKGAYMIDRDPAYFQVVINFLRHGRLLMTPDVTEEGVLLEAEYFNLPELAKAIQQRMSERESSLRSRYQLHHLHSTAHSPFARANQGTSHAGQLASYAAMPESSAYLRNIDKLNLNRSLYHDQVTSRHQQSDAAIYSIDYNSATINSLIGGQEYLTSYVNNILGEKQNQAGTLSF